MRPRSTQPRRQANEWLLLLIIVPLAIVVVLFLADEQKAAKSHQRETEFVAKFGTDIPAMCRQMNDDTRPIATGYAVNYLMMRTLLLDEKGNYHPMQDEVSAPFAASSRNDLNLLVCIEDDVDIIEICEYYDEEHPGITKFTISRLQHTMRVVLLDPATDSYVGEFTVVGGWPDECPDQARSDHKHIFGSDITYIEFMATLNQALGNTDN